MTVIEFVQHILEVGKHCPTVEVRLDSSCPTPIEDEFEVVAEKGWVLLRKKGELE